MHIRGVGVRRNGWSAQEAEVGVATCQAGLMLKPYCKMRCQGATQVQVWAVTLLNSDVLHQAGSVGGIALKMKMTGP